MGNTHGKMVPDRHRKRLCSGDRGKLRPAFSLARLRPRCGKACHSLPIPVISANLERRHITQHTNRNEVIMETMNIALPDGLKEYVQERVSSGGYSSVSEYIRELIRLDQKQNAVSKIDSLLLQGIKSGKPVEVNEEFWKQKRQALARRGPKRR